MRIRHLATLAAVLPTLLHAETPFETWNHRFDPNVGSSPSARAIAVDRSGFVAVAGFTFINGDEVFYISRHDPFTGTVTPGWPRSYDGGTDSIANAAAFDSAGNLIVAGSTNTNQNGVDFVTRKYDRLGNLLWSVPFDQDQGLDEALFVAVDSQDNVIVTGRSTNGAVSGEDIYTVKYSPSGTQLSEFRYTSASTRQDYPTGLVIDGDDKVIVCGVTTVASGDGEFYLAKYNMSASQGTADWTRIFGTVGRDDMARDVAVDRSNNVIVTGLRRNDANNTHRFCTRKYNPTGGLEWEQTYPNILGDFDGGARSVAVDAAGNVFVTGLAVADNFNTTFYTAKSFADSGALDWEVRGPFVEDESIDADNLSPVHIEVDPSGNPIISGSPGVVGRSADYYLAKYSSNGEGALLWEKWIPGAFPNEGTDTVKAMAVDPFGNIAITGDSLREAGTNFEIFTLRFGATALATGDPIAGPGIPDNAFITQVNNPAVADAGTVAVRITAGVKRKKVAAIVTVGGPGGLTLPAVQGTPAPGIANATFKSFSDPVVSPNGSIAFLANVSGVKGAEASGVWTTAFNPNGALELALQKGKQVPGMNSGIVLQSVLSISLRDNQLLALIKVAGKSAGVKGPNATVLYGLTDIGVGTVLMRAGDPITVGGTDTTIKSLTVFTPPKGSAGHGRYHGNVRAIARATLADKRTAILTALNNGTIAVLAHTGQSTGALVTDGLWQSFSLPAIDTAGSRYALLGGLAIGEGGVTKKDDTIIGLSLNGVTFTKIAREGDPSPGIANGSFASFQEPLVNSNSRVAFIGTAAGQGISGKNRTGIWFGPAGALDLVARTNDPGFPATDGSGSDIDAHWSAFTSIALPGGANAGPLFIAKISGRDAGRSAVGLWAVDTAGFVRKLIRVGDRFGDITVKKFTVLTPSAGSVGATRSFSSNRSVALLVTFSDRSTGVLTIGIP